MIARSRMASLEMRHEQADARLAEEQARPSPDHLTVTQIKRTKLMLKDEIRRGAS